MAESITITPYEKDTPLVPMARTGIDAIASEIVAGNSTGLENFFAFSARFPHRSLLNQMLIFQQAPGALAVRSFEEWAEAGFPVAKGAKGIRVLQQKTWTKGAEGQEAENVTAMVSGAVFDVSQLSPEAVAKHPVPDELYNLPAYSVADLSSRLEAAIAGEGLTVVETDDPASVTSQRKVLIIRPNLKGAQKVADMLFAWATYLARFDRDGQVVDPEVQKANGAAAFFALTRRYGIKTRFGAREILPHMAAESDALYSQLDTIRGIATRMMRRIEDGPRAAHVNREEK